MANDGVHVAGTGRNVKGEGEIGGRWVCQELYY